MGNSEFTSLANKYRPRIVDDIVGQDHVKSIIKSSVKSGKCHSTYLFHGPAGNGKTSSARIFAASFNTRSMQYEGDYKKLLDQKSVDIVEIDAASNRSIDDIRSLRNEIKYMPSEFPKRFIIIDEAQGLTGHAAEASLKMLEEPPAHNVFILCTTEKDKIKETIISRCIEIPFVTPHSDEISDHIIKISNLEGVSLEKRSVKKIVKLSNNCLRLCLQNLEKLISCSDSKSISDDFVNQIFCVMEEDNVIKLFMTLINKNTHDGMVILNEMMRVSNSHHVVIDAILEFIKNVLIIKTIKNPSAMIDSDISNPDSKNICKSINLVTFFDIISIIKESQEHIRLGAPADNVFHYMFIKMVISVQNNVKKENQ